MSALPQEVQKKLNTLIWTVTSQIQLGVPDERSLRKIESRLRIALSYVHEHLPRVATSPTIEEQAVLVKIAKAARELSEPVPFDKAYQKLYKLLDEWESLS